MKNIIVVYPGRFQPFHKGHKSVYDKLCSQYDPEHVYICTSNKVDGSRSPFTFQEKSSMMESLGIPSSQIVESSQPYRALEIIKHYDPSKCILLFAVSEKDMKENPRFSFAIKRDGNPSYFQPAPNDIQTAQTFDKHGYIITVPTIQFNVLGTQIQSASELRSQLINSTDSIKQSIITDLYQNNSIIDIIKSKL